MAYRPLTGATGLILAGLLSVSYCAGLLRLNAPSHFRVRPAGLRSREPRPRGQSWGPQLAPPWSLPEAPPKTPPPYLGHLHPGAAAAWAERRSLARHGAHLLNPEANSNLDSDPDPEASSDPAPAPAP